MRSTSLAVQFPRNLVHRPGGASQNDIVVHQAPYTTPTSHQHLVDMANTNPGPKKIVAVEVLDQTVERAT